MNKVRFEKAPVGAEIFDGYKVSADGQDIPVYQARVSAVPYNTPWPGRQRPEDQTELAGFITLSAAGKVQLSVEIKKKFSDVLIRPLSRKVKAAIEGNICKFTLPGVGHYTLEADGYHGALHIFVNPIKEFSGSGKVIRFGAGIHEIGDLRVESHTTVIIDDGAIVYGSITAFGAEDVNILGYGIIDGSREVRGDGNRLLPLNYDKKLPTDIKKFNSYCENELQLLHGCVRLYRCKNCRVEGIIMRDSATFALIPAGCENIIIDNVKTVGMWKYNSDGIDIFNSSNITVRNCFLRNFDDCMVIKGICGWDDRNNENILVENCVIWCDWGRGLEIGAETNAPEYRNIIFRDCDLIHGSTVHIDIQHHNYAEIHHIMYQNIRAEYTKYQLSDVFQNDMSKPYPEQAEIRHPMLIWIPIFHSGLFSKTGKNGCVHDVIYDGIHVLTDDPDINFPAVIFQGLDKKHRVENVVMKHFTFNGKKIKPKFSANQFTKNVKAK